MRSWRKLIYEMEFFPIIENIVFFNFVNGNGSIVMRCDILEY